MFTYFSECYMYFLIYDVLYMYEILRTKLHNIAINALGFRKREKEF